MLDVGEPGQTRTLFICLYLLQTTAWPQPWLLDQSSSSQSLQRFVLWRGLPPPEIMLQYVTARPGRRKPSLE